MNNKEKLYLVKFAKEYKSWEERGIKNPGWLARLRGPNNKPFDKKKVKTITTLLAALMGGGVGATLGSPLVMPGGNVSTSLGMGLAGALAGGTLHHYGTRSLERNLSKQKKDLDDKKKRGEKFTEQDIANLEYLNSAEAKETMG